VFTEAAATVELGGRIAVVHFEVEHLGVEFTRSGFSEVQQLCADSLPAMCSLDKQFVDPCALTAVFEAVVETDHQVADWRRFFADHVDNAIERVLQEFGKIRAERECVEWLRPGIIPLHVAHHFEKKFEIGDGSLGDAKRHEMRNPLE
jgi:hypothetical protein